MVFDEQIGMEDVSQEYKDFVEKFKPKKTTDDCYTPENVYNAVKGWVCREYGIEEEQIVRPFWPGADYTKYDYPMDCCVLDNPPFSILRQITQFYNRHGISFFLFAPGLVVFQQLKDFRNCAIITATPITYENGAVVRTAFITNLEPEWVAWAAPELARLVQEANDENTKSKQALLKYTYPDEVCTAAMLQKCAHGGVSFAVRKTDAVLISALDAQRAAGKTIFGSGLLLSEKAAAEKAAAEKAAAEKAAAEKAAAEKAIIWGLSEREKMIIAELAEDHHAEIPGEDIHTGAGARLRGVRGRGGLPGVSAAGEAQTEMQADQRDPGEDQPAQRGAEAHAAGACQFHGAGPGCGPEL